MSSVLYSGGLNYQAGNPVRTEIVSVRRDVGELRKQIETLTEENLILRKYLMKLMKDTGNEGSINELTRELMSLTSSSSSQSNDARQPGMGTVQGGGFRR
jgi:regulator of replication initiation timing